MFPPIPDISSMFPACGISRRFAWSFASVPASFSSSRRIPPASHRTTSLAVSAPSLRPTLCSAYSRISFALLYPRPRSFAACHTSRIPSVPRDFRLGGERRRLQQFQRKCPSTFPNASSYSGKWIFISLCSRFRFRVRSSVS